MLYRQITCVRCPGDYSPDGFTPKMRISPVAVKIGKSRFFSLTGMIRPATGMDFLTVLKYFREDIQNGSR